MSDKGEVEITAGGVVILHGEKLRTLGELMYHQEVNCVQNVPFHSENERIHFLNESKAVFDKASSLSKDAADLLEDTKNGHGIIIPTVSEREPEPVPQPIELVTEYLGYIELAVGFALTSIKNVNLRKAYLSKVEAHAYTLYLEMKKLTDLKPLEAQDSASKLIKRLAQFKKTTFNSLILKADPSSQYLSRAFRQSPKSYTQLVEEYRLRLMYDGKEEFAKPFNSLSHEQQLEIYDQILQDQGIPSSFPDKEYKLVGEAGKLVLLITFAISVYDVTTSKHKVFTAFKEAAEFGGGYYAGSLTESLEATLISAIIPSAQLIETSVVLAGILGTGTLIVGFFGGFYAAKCIGEVFDKYVINGGTGDAGGTKKPTMLSEHSNIDKLHAYSAPMPDGVILSHRLAYAEP